MIKELTPPSIRELQPLVDAFDTSFEELKKHIIKVLIYPRIDEIEDEKLLDLLAWQFHIEGYDQAQTIQEKRNLIKHAIELHRYKGTPYAIKKVFQALNLEAELSEWFDYNGDPYKFKINITTTDRQITPEFIQKLRDTIEQYKNVRSWLDELILTYLNKISCPYQTANMAEIGSYTEQLREFTFESKSTTWYQTANMAEVMSYAIMQ
jgi:phage tail P2-like protein